MALTKLTKNLIDGTFGTEWDSTVQTSNFTAVAGKGYFVNTTSGQITVTLPAGTVGNEVIIQDYAGTFATNKVIFTANGSEKIQGTTDNYECTIANATVNLVYQDTTKGWTADNIQEYQPPLTLNYLVVAGGGGGGYDDNGGAGAGGLRTSYGSTSGGGASSENAFTFALATNYTVTVGAGGTGAQNNPAPTNGSDSVFSTITSDGGGAAGRTTPSANDGGCGSGASGNVNVTTPGQGTTGQGFDGGNGFLRTPPGGVADEGGGGGGGAGAVGGNASQYTGGAGGAGLAVSITGSSVTYAGGGGGGGTTTGGAGGSGGGAAGTGAANPSAANVNTGGGGGTAGANSGSYTGSNGGSGIVILRYANTYTLTATGTLVQSTATDGNSKVTTFTAGTGNIQLN